MEFYHLYYRETLELTPYMFDLQVHALSRSSIAKTWLYIFQVQLQPRKSKSDFLQHRVCAEVLLCRFSELLYTGNDRKPIYRDTQVIRYVLHRGQAKLTSWLGAALLCLI